LGGAAAASEHLADCALCRGRLAEKQAMANRLKEAFSGIHAPASLAERIRQETSVALPGEAGSARSRFRAHWRGWAAAVSAIAALLVVVPILMYLTTPPSAVAALADIHRHNMSESGAFVSEADPAKLAAYFKEHLGFNPRLPEPNHGLALRGCCVRHFQGDIAGSYVVATPAGIMSVVVVRRTPESMGITQQLHRNDRVYWKGSFARSRMVCVRIGDYTYCAVGEISHEYLTDLLSRLLAEAPQK
jgi:hypothetical protein